MTNYALLLTHDLKSGIEDVTRLKKLLTNYKIHSVVGGIPIDEINKFINDNDLTEDDTLFIYCSCHGEKRGIKINNKIYILTCWINPDKSITTSQQIDELLSTVSCKIIFITDCCHSETFGDFFNGNSLTFIGSSNINSVSGSYSIDDKPYCGILVCLLEYLVSMKGKLTWSNKQINNIKKTWKHFFKKYNIKQELIIKIINT